MQHSQAPKLYRLAKIRPLCDNGAVPIIALFESLTVPVEAQEAVMAAAHDPWPARIPTPALDAGTPEYRRYLRYATMRTRLQARIRDLHGHLERLHACIADDLAVGSPEALVAAAARAEALAHAAVDLAQLEVFVADYALRLDALRNPPAH